MTFPSFQVYFLPVLQLLNEKPKLAIRDLREVMSKRLKLTEADLKERTAGGTQTKHHDRITWTLVYLKQAGLIQSVARGIFAITAEGKKLLEEGRDSLCIKDLYNYPSFVEFKNRTRSPAKSVKPKESVDEELNPKESLIKTHEEINQFLAAELLEAIKKQTPDFFEQLVAHLLERMGYGGKLQNKGEVTGGSGDGGIDAVIDQDALGLEKIYVQAKRYESTVPAAALRDFVGALNLKGASKGVFFTTSNFPQRAADNIAQSPQNVILVDGEQLAQLMIKYQLGVTVEDTISLCRLDSDYFEE